MVSIDESNEAAESDVLDVIGGNVIETLAAASRKHNVAISIYITSNYEGDDEPQDAS